MMMSYFTLLFLVTWPLPLLLADTVFFTPPLVDIVPPPILCRKRDGTDSACETTPTTANNNND